MSELRVGYDVVIAGAGPAGIAAAAALAERGAAVLLNEAEPGAARRLAGEWMHPSGVEVLARLGLLPEEAILDHPMGRGFAMFPEDGSAPIELPYTRGLGFSCEHEVFVRAMRERIAQRARVRYVEGVRLMELSDGRVRLRVGEGVRDLEAGLVVGADGKGSTVRRRLSERNAHGTGPLHDAESAPAISQMAGILLEGVDLPYEGMGHVFVGGPGPALAYRLDSSTVRLCLDVPSAHGRRGPADLYAAFSPALPAGLRAALRDALETRPVLWAGIRLRARLNYGRGVVALVGDAVGVVHPLCAAGMTLGILDADRLARAKSVAAYARRREAESHVPELLSQALYEVLVRFDESASAIRDAMYRTFRESPAERARTMDLLAGREVRREVFSSAFVNVALSATREAAAAGPRGAVRSMRRLSEWSRYPARALAPRVLRLRHRARGAREALRVRPLSPVSEAPLELDRALLHGAPERPEPTAPKLIRAADALARATEPSVVCALARELSDAFARAASPSLEELVAVAESLAEVIEVHPGLAGLDDQETLRGVASAVLACEAEGGGFGSVGHTAAAILALRATGARSVSGPVRRAVDSLLDRQREDGGFADGDADPVRVTARALRALLRADCADTAAVHRAAHRLARAFPFDARVAEDARAALALYHRRLAEGPTTPARRLRANADGSLVGAEWEYCVEALERVSRSFARPIAALPEPLRVAVTCGYLLCRIADTVEDAPDTRPEVRDVHYGRLLDVLEGRRPPSHFTRGINALPGTADELELCARLGRVLHVLDTVPPAMSDAVRRWATEMVRGMGIYSHRPLGPDGLRAPAGVADLERYCYFVAGTVGHMLTELFLLHMPSVAPGTVRALREQAESFGIGLQLVNILKDITDDQARGVSYVPRSLADGRGLALPDLLDGSKRVTAHHVVEPLFEVARGHLDRALEYTLAIPRSEPRVRLFCLLPLWMAARTLVHARGNDAMFVPDRAVKIDRAEVEALAADCLARAGSDDALRAGYAALWETPRKARRAAQPVL